MPYSDFQIQISPTALQNPQGRSWMRALGAVKDYYLAQAKRGVLQRFPDYASTDALGAIGSERRIDRGSGPQIVQDETDAAYATRLRQAWSIWYWGGTAYGMLQALYAQGYSPRVIQQNGIDWSLDGSGNLVMASRPPWTFPAPNLWNTFLVLFTAPPSSWTNIQNPPTTTSSPSIYEVNRLVRIINLWRPAHMLCAGMEVVTSGRIWGGPGLTWGSGVWGGSAVTLPVPASSPGP